MDCFLLQKNHITIPNKEKKKILNMDKMKKKKKKTEKNGFLNVNYFGFAHVLFSFSSPIVNKHSIQLKT